jgi:hypothetical protein
MLAKIMKNMRKAFPMWAECNCIVFLQQGIQQAPGQWVWSIL